MANTNDEIIENLIQNQNKLDFILQYENNSFPLENVTISKESTPVTKPTVRGGSYFSDTAVYKIKGTTTDISIVSIFSKAMLGPNTDFKELEIKTINKNQKISLFTNLTNSVQSSSKVELNMTIVRTLVNQN